MESYEMSPAIPSQKTWAKHTTLLVYSNVSNAETNGLEGSSIPALC